MATSAIQVLTYVTPTEIIIQNAQDQVITALNVLKSSIPDPDTPPANSDPAYNVFDAMSPAAAAQLRIEIDGIITAVDAAPVV